ncbi:hypothetical protein [Melissospora conviva]|uniref:hypothetical protein n=1 Tax=Melissospora conviva TaxID=3388432 RepID=UPI003C24D20B
MRLGSGDTALELDRRRRRVEQVIEHARHNRDPEVAAGIVEAASMVEPDLFQQSPRYRSQLYVSKVALAIETCGLLTSRGDLDGGPDLWVHSGSDTFAVEVKYLSGPGPLNPRRIREMRDRHKTLPTLIVTNATVPLAVRQRVAEDTNGWLQIVTWEKEIDTPRLLEGLISLKSAIEDRERRNGKNLKSD